MATKKTAAKTTPVNASTPDIPHCGVKLLPKRTFGPGVAFDRAEIIGSNDKFWANGTKLTYYFYTDGRASDVANGAEVKLVRAAFAAWKKIGIGLTFEEVQTPSAAVIRIAFVRGDGAWSYIGRGCLDIPLAEPTMNFGWNLLQDPRKIGVAIHEIGHALGFPHEHQNPKAGIVWNKAEVLRVFSGPPNNWDEAKIRSNILDKLPQTKLRGSNWDPDSIMEYAFPAGLVQLPKPYDTTGINPPGDRLSPIDIDWTRQIYPPLSNSDFRLLGEAESVQIQVEHGKQANFRFQPKTSRQYEMRLFGKCDAVMVLFEDRGRAGSAFLIGKDDSGTDDNVYIKLRLEQGKTYLIKVRMLYRNPDVVPAIMVW